MTTTQILTLLLFTLSVAGCHFSFGLVDRLRKVTAKQHVSLLRKNALLVALGIFLLHCGYQTAADNIPRIAQHPVELTGSLLCAYILSLSLLGTVNKKTLPLRELIYASVTAGLSAYLLSYLYQVSAGAINLRIDSWTALFAFFLACLTSALAIVTMLWIKSYEGKALRRLKMMFSVEIALGFLASHTAINLSILHNNIFIGQPSDQTGNYLVLLLTLAPVLLFITSFILVIFYERNVDITQSKLTFRNTQTASKRLMAYDPLTHLPNRDALNQHLAINAKRCDRNGESLALAYIDLDHFKPVNDQFGHHIGDLLLIEVAKRISNAIRNCDYVARAGGDEFIAILSEIESHQSVVAVIQRIIDALRTTFVIENHVIEISCSIGIAMYPQDGNLKKLKLNADAAMYKAKENGKNQYRFFDAEIEQASDEMQQTRIELKKAITEQEFRLLFQPKVDAMTRLVYGAEALLRWQHPSRGLLSPTSFIEAAERFGMIEEINAWVISQTCHTISQARARGIDLNISVNLSSQQFRNKQLGMHIQSILEAHQVDARNLILEVSATNVTHPQIPFKETLRDFSQQGLKISLDDFGLHPVNLTHLQDLEVNEVKLDRSLTRHVATSAPALAIVEAMVKLAHALGLNVVAEGVEEEDQRRALTSVGCDQMQGYLFSRPVEQQFLFDAFSQLQLKSPTPSLF
ncbi:diguanylate cyclase/phosphodiesterase [Methylophilus rhizosphaerae]|uniref:Diguanylate cyclase/phosphodiesterase n=1 Tax=Methylophilus rhizosphaerae TaxID=492660 RepID=A0A1G8ZS73_9PROT|nr:EAL domain-containing protein [Methylophilus rhizosphaerae]SDK17893.1 diguanylate cyclase/phosphodiesterase [Methylophilus rhizosphaerae]